MSSKVVGTHKADDNHNVVTVKSDSGESSYRKSPCKECPWRKDSPVGAFPAEAYRHSARTAYDMATSVFGCHMHKTKNPTTCAGFLLKGAAHNQQVRVAMAFGRINPNDVRSDVELYGSYREMAEANGVDPSDPVLKPMSQAKAEVDAFVTHAIHTTGLEKLRDQAPQLQIEDKTKVK